MHFSLLLLTSEEPTVERIGELLEPYREYDGGNTPVENVDKTEEVKSHYATDTVKRLRNPQGELYDPCDDQFYRLNPPQPLPRLEPQGAFIIPDGWEKVDVPVSETMSLAQFAEKYLYLDDAILSDIQAPDMDGQHKWGWIEVNADGELVKAVKRYNPNGKWDWWDTRGRYANRLQKWGDGSVSMCRKRDVDWDKVLDARLRVLQGSVNGTLQRISQSSGKSMRELLDMHIAAGQAVCSIRALWQRLPEQGRPPFYDYVQNCVDSANPVYQAVHCGLWGDLGLTGALGDEIPETEPNPWLYLAEQDLRLSAFAVLYDGQWQEAPWECEDHHPADEKKRWKDHICELVQQMDDNDWLVYIDCHC